MNKGIDINAGTNAGSAIFLWKEMIMESACSGHFMARALRKPKPCFDLLRLLLHFPFGRVLYGQSPALQILADGTNGHNNPISLLNQLTHIVPCPQATFEFQLIRSSICKNEKYLLFLFRCKMALFAFLSTARLELDS